jgi:type I restriction enzyme S subunit
VNEKFWVNNHTHVLAGINEIYSTEWLYLSLIKYPIIGQITGAAQPKITQANLNKINLLTPTEEILIQFNKKILSAFELINNILKQNTHITISRDRLLSRLMSGKIDVEHLDIQSPPSMKEEEASA